MKTFLGKLSLIALAALTPIALQAQSRTIVYGRTTISFAPAAAQVLSGVGVSVTDLAGAQLPNGVLTLKALEGVIDLQTSLGDVFFEGGLQVSAAGQSIRVQDMALETSSSTSSVITGQVTYNGTVIGPRQAIFMVNASPSGSLPLVPQNGTLTLSGLSLGLSPAFANLINGAAGQALITPAMQVGTADTYVVLSAAQ